MRKPVSGVSDQVRHKLAYTVTDARILNIWVKVEEELYYLYGENKGAYQMCSYCTADLRLYFGIGKNPVFSLRGSYIMYM